MITLKKNRVKWTLEWGTHPMINRMEHADFAEVKRVYEGISGNIFPKRLIPAEDEWVIYSSHDDPDWRPCKKIKVLPNLGKDGSK